MTASLAELPVDQEFENIITKNDFIPNPVEAIIAAERSLVGSEARLHEDFTPAQVEESLKVLQAIGNSVIQLPTTPRMAATKRAILGLTKEEAEQEVNAFVAKSDTRMAKMPEDFDDLSESAQKVFEATNVIRRNNKLVARRLTEAAAHADDPEVIPVKLTAEVSEIALAGIRLELVKAHQAHHEQDDLEPEEKVLAGTYRWIIEHTVDNVEVAA